MRGPGNSITSFAQAAKRIRMTMAHGQAEGALVGKTTATPADMIHGTEAGIATGGGRKMTPTHSHTGGIGIDGRWLVRTAFPKMRCSILAAAFEV